MNRPKGFFHKKDKHVQHPGEVVYKIDQIGFRSKLWRSERSSRSVAECWRLRLGFSNRFIFENDVNVDYDLNINDRQRLVCLR